MYILGNTARIYMQIYFVISTGLFAHYRAAVRFDRLFENAAKDTLTKNQRDYDQSAVPFGILPI